MGPAGHFEEERQHNVMVTRSEIRAQREYYLTRVSVAFYISSELEGKFDPWLSIAVLAFLFPRIPPLVLQQAFIFFYTCFVRSPRTKNPLPRPGRDQVLLCLV